MKETETEICSLLGNDKFLDDIESEISNPNDFIYIQKLGKGGFSSVFKVYCKSTGQYLALKSVHLHPLSNEDHFYNLLKNEIKLLQIMSLNSNDYFIKLMKIYKKQDASDEKDELNFMIAMECGITSLHDILKIKSFPEAEAVYIIKDIIKKLNCAHSMKIYHGDVKPSNICIFPDEKNRKYQYKFIDFGVGQIVNNPDDLISISEIKGFTNFYVAPEIRKRKKYTFIDPFKADIYSLGITFLEMVGVFRKNKIRNKNVLKPENIQKNIKNKDLASLIEAMLQKEPNFRINGVKLEKNINRIPCEKPNFSVNFNRILSKHTKLRPIDAFEKFIELGKIYYFFREFKIARSYFKSCSEHADMMTEEEETILDYEEKKTMLYNNLGLTYFALEKYEKSQKFLEISRFFAMNYLQNDFYNDIQIIILSNMALISTQFGDLNRALKLILKALKLKLTVDQDNVFLYGILIMNLAMIYYEKGFIKEAMDYLKHSLKILLLDEDFSYPFFLQTDSTEKPILFNSVDEKTYDIAVAYNNKALLHYKLNEMSEANDAINESLRRFTYLFGEKNSIVMILYYNKAFILKKLGYEKDSCTFFQKIRSFFFEKEVPFEISYIFLNYSKKKKVQKRLLQQYSLLKQEVFVSNIFNLCYIGECFIIENSINQALNCFKKALNLNLYLMGTQFEPFAISLNNYIGFIYMIYTKNLMKSLKYFMKAIKLARVYYSKFDEVLHIIRCHIVEVLIQIGVLSMNQKKLQNALEYFSGARCIMRQNLRIYEKFKEKIDKCLKEAFVRNYEFCFSNEIEGVSLQIEDEIFDEDLEKMKILVDSKESAEDLQNENMYSSMLNEQRENSYFCKNSDDTFSEKNTERMLHLDDFIDVYGNSKTDVFSEGENSRTV